MIFPADDVLVERPEPTALYAAAASANAANVWTSVNGYASARLYESLEKEYQAAKDGAVIADFGALSHVTARGKDAAALLSRLATAPASQLNPGESARGLMLDDHGGVLDLAEISRLTDDLFLLTTPFAHPREFQLAARGLEVEVESLGNGVGAIAILGKDANEAMAAAGLKIRGDHMAASAVLGGVETAARPIQFGALPGTELIFPASDALTIWERLMRRTNARPIGLDAMDILRIESGAPRPGLDFSNRLAHRTDRRLSPSEIGLPHLAPLNSGWYNGRRSLRFAAPAPARALITLSIDAETALPGAAVANNGKVIGRITSTAWSPMRRRAIAFATVSADNIRNIKGLSVSCAAGDDHAAELLETAESRLAAAYAADQAKTTD